MTGRCPTCHEVPRRRARKLPLQKALDHLNPLQPLLCPSCNGTFWRLKEWPRALAATLLMLLVAAVVGNAALQLALYLDGHVYRQPIDERLAADIDPALRCPACGSGALLRSIPQPLDRAAAPVNPAEPYRCLDCQARFWARKPPSAAALSVAVLVTVVAAVARVPLAYRKRRREMRGR